MVRMEIEKNRDNSPIIVICVLILMALLSYSCWQYTGEQGAPHRIFNVTQAEDLPPDATAIIMNPARDEFFEILKNKEGFKTVGHFLLFGRASESDLSGRSIAIIADHCPSLYYISIENCHNITN